MVKSSMNQNELGAAVDGPGDRDRRTIRGRSVLALDNVARAVVFGDCIRVQMPASSSFASIRLKAKVEKAFRISYCLVFRPESRDQECCDSHSCDGPPAIPIQDQRNQARPISSTG